MLNAYSGKVYVSFRHHTEYFPDWSKEANPCSEIDYSFPKTRYIMEVESAEFCADIETEIHPSVSKDVIASCLTAGLKLIPEHEMVYEEIASQLRTNIGIAVSREVSPEIAEIEHMKYLSNGVPRYFINIKNGVGLWTPKCVITANLLEKEGAVRLDFDIENRGKKMRVSSKHDGYFFKYEGPAILKEQQLRVLSELHQKFPEWGAEWEIFRVQWFGEGETLTKQGADSWVGQKPKTENFAGGGRDPRVSLLPGLNAEVKHPATGRLCRLEDAIISLNDHHNWSREQVADWLETLDVDITFKVPNEQD